MVAHTQRAGGQGAWRTHSGFYIIPRFVKHIDDEAIDALTALYAAVFSTGPAGKSAFLDLCSSWVSHYPKDLKASRVAITGMNWLELAANRQVPLYGRSPGSSSSSTSAESSTTPGSGPSLSPRRSSGLRPSPAFSQS